MNDTQRMIIEGIQDKGRKVIEDELSKDPLWIEASKKIYNTFENKPFQGEDADAVQYGLDKMGEFNYNVGLGTIPHAVKVTGADDESKVAYAYLMHTYEQKDTTLAGFGRALKEASIDPFNYIGTMSLGTGFLAKKATETTAKEGFKYMLKQGVEKYVGKQIVSEPVKAGIAGGAYIGGQTLAEEQINTVAGLQEQIDMGNVLTSTALGVGLGAGITKGVEKISKGLDK